MLDTALSTEFVPGTNVKGDVAGANWLFLLPSLELKLVVCVGQPSAAGLLALARVSNEIIVIKSDAAASVALDHLRQKNNLSNVRAITDVAAIEPGSVSLIWLSEEGVRHLARDTASALHIRQMLAANGLIYFEQNGNSERSEVGRRIVAPGGATQRFWLTPLTGEMHTAVPATDQQTKAYFLRYGLTSRSLNLGLLKRTLRGRLQPASPKSSGQHGMSSIAGSASGKGFKGRAKGAMRSTLAKLYSSVQHTLDGTEARLNNTSFFEGMVSRYGILVGNSPTALTEQPPHYLRHIAHAGGVNLDFHRWGLSARGEYSSRKVLVFLFNQANEAPEYIVKMTRDMALNPRLENEYRALLTLAERGIGDRETLPRVAFFGHHCGLAVLGETIVDGVPFENRASGDADCQYVHSAIDWLTDLGARTVDRSAASSHQVAGGLDTLFQRFDEIYRLESTERDFLATQIASIADMSGVFPLVFQHGDPGTWNAMVTQSGRTAFLDWEAAESHGMPLWDLFYFIRTYGAWSLRTAISGDITKGFAAQFLNNTPFQSLLVEATVAYCDRVGIPGRLVEPLFYTCWMHRGLKEATRLAPGMLAHGHYFNVLRASIAQREVVQNLFSVAVLN